MASPPSAADIRDPRPRPTRLVAVPLLHGVLPMRRFRPLAVLSVLLLGVAGCNTVETAPPPPVAADDPALLRVMTASCVEQLSRETTLAAPRIQEMCTCMAPVAARHMPGELRAELRSGEPSGRQYPIDRAAMDAELRTACSQAAPYLEAPAARR